MSRTPNRPAEPPPQALVDLLQANPKPQILIDREFRIVAANQAYADRYQLASPEAVVGKRCHRVSHQSDVPCYLNGEDCPHQRVFSGEQWVEVTHRHLTPEGKPEYVAISAHPIRGADGALTWMSESLLPQVEPEQLAAPETAFLGRAPAFTRALSELTRVADSELAVLITGETGTGKELAAHYVHRRSPRAGGPFVPVDGNVLTEELFASELFGHERGAFTGALQAKKGLFQLADGGTLFLDEIGDIPPSIQTKLLRVLETGSFRRVGGTELRHANVRLVCATNRDLPKLIQEGRFRADLYYRIAHAQITLPPLRERREDLLELASHFLRRGAVGGAPPRVFSPEARRLLLNYPWPGNIRELAHTVQRAALQAEGPVIEAAHLPPELREASPPGLWRRAVDQVQNKAQSIQEALARFGGNRRLAAAYLGVSERTLYRRLREQPGPDTPLPAPDTASDRFGANGHKPH